MAFTRPKASQINFDVTNITDPLIRLNSGQTGSPSKDVGLVIERGDSTNAAIIYDESADKFVFINTTEDGTTSGNVTISSYADLQAATINTGILEIGGTAVTSTAAELNILDGVTVTATELNYVSGVTSAIQTQIDNISSSFTLSDNQGTPNTDTFTTGQTLTFAGSTGIDTTVSDNQVAIAIDSTVATLTGSQTLTNKTLTLPTIGGTGASFSGSTSGATALVAAATAGATTITMPATTGTMALTSDIPTAVSELTNDSGYSTTTGTVTSVAGTGTVNGLTLSGTVTSSGNLTLGGTFSATVSEISDLTATATELNYTDGVTSNIQTQLDAKAPLAAPAFTGTATGVNLTLSGDLTVNGTTTTVNTTNLVVTDNLIELNNGAASNANDSGIVIERGSTGDNAIFMWDESADKFVVGTTTATGASTGDLTVTTGTLVANLEGNVTGNVTGNTSGSSGSTTGNAATATALETARTIAGQSFDGTANITIASTDLSDTASIVLTTASQTLTNKTLTAPVISSISNTGTLTLPTSTGTVALTSDITLSTLSVTATASELNILDGVTSTAAELNLLDGVTGTLVTEAGSQTLTNKTLTSPVVTTDIRLNAQAELEFYDADSSNYVSFRAPGTVASNITWTLPNSDGTADQVLATNGSGTLSWADAGGGGGSGSSFPNSTFTTCPGSEGNFDLSYNVAQTSQETPFEASGTDAFGVNLGSVFSLMDPVGSTDGPFDMGVLT